MGASHSKNRVTIPLGNPRGRARQQAEEVEKDEQVGALLAALREEKRGSFIERKGGVRLAEYEEEGGGADRGNDNYAASYETAYEGF